MNQKKNKRNIMIFYVLAFLQGLVFYSSIATLYRTSNGITLFQMGIIESIFSIFMIAFELPWGIICDRIGYKKTMIIANGVYFLSKVVFWKANGFGMFLLERLLLAISVSGLSGCDSSLLYLSIEPKEATGVYGKQSMFGVMGMVAASLSLTFVFKTDMQMAAFATAVAYFFAFILTLFLEDKKEVQEKQLHTKNILQVLKQNKSMFIVLLASVLLTESTHMLTIFYNQLQYERVGVPIAYYGIIFMLLQFVSMSCGLLGNITKYISKEKLAYILFGMAGVGTVGLFFSEEIVSTMICLMILTCTEYMYFPILTTIENESVEVSARATMLSVYSLICNMFTVFTNFSFGKAADVSLKNAYVLAFVFCVCGFLLFVAWHKIYKKDKTNAIS